MNAPMTIYHAEVVPFADMQKMAAAVAESGLFGMKDTKQALALMLTAQAEGQHPATITQDYDIIQGKAARKTHSVLARYQQAGGSVEWHALTDAKADATFTPPPSAGKPLRMEWTIDMAKKAGLTDKDNWRKYPRAMLRARCIAEGIRATYPGAIGGMLLVEEAQDLDRQPEKDAGSGSAVEMPKAKSQSAVIDAETGEVTTQSSAPAATGTPSPATTTGGAAPDQPMKPSQAKIIQAKLTGASLTELDLEVAFPGKSLSPKEGKDLFGFGQFNTVVEWIEKNRKG